MATIQDRYVRAVVSLEASATCGDAVRLMEAHGIGSIGVRAGGRLVALVTERDLVHVAAGGADLARTSLAEVMRPDAPSVAPRASEAECAELMRRHATRHLAVREGGELVGVISLLDLVDLVVAEKQWSVDQLESYIRGGRASQLSQPITTVFHHERAAV